MGRFINYWNKDGAYQKIFTLFWGFGCFFNKVIVKGVEDLYYCDFKIVNTKAYLR